MRNRVTPDRPVPRNCDLAVGIACAYAPRAATPVGNDRISQVTEVRTRDRFEKAPAEQNLLLRQPDNDVVARVACAGKEKFALI